MSEGATNQKVTVTAALPAGNNNIGDVDVASIAAGDNTIGRVKLTDGTTVATVRELGTNDALNVAIADGSGNQITSFGGGTQYTEGDTDSSITGTALLHEVGGDTLATVSSANPLPISDNGGAITVDGIVTANAGTNLNTSLLALESGGNLAAAAASLGVIDDWDESDRAKTNPIVGQAGVQGGSGTVSDNTQRVVLATDIALPAGNNNIGDVDIASALPAGNNNIGDVDVASLPAATNAGAAAKTLDYDTGAGTDTVTGFGILLPASGGAVAGGTSTNPVRTDPTGTTTQPVSGTVTANAGTNLNTSALALESGGNLAAAAASLSVIDDWDESDRAKTNPIVGQAGVQGGSGAVSANTQRVVLATDVALPTGTNSIGAVTQATASNFNAQVVGNVAHDAADSGNPVKVGGIAFVTAANPAQVAAADRCDARTTLWGGLLVSGHLNVKTVRNTYAASQSSTVLLAVSGGTRVRILSVSVRVDADTSVAVSADVRVGSTVLDSHPGIAPGGGFTTPCYEQPGADGEDIIVNCSTPTDGNVDFVVKYYEETV